MNRRYRDADFLRDQYCIQGKSVTEIAELCNVTSSTISRWMERQDIEQEGKYKQKAWLEEQYIRRDKDQQEIADMCGVAKTTICHWLARKEITDGKSLTESECKTCGDTFRYYPSVRDGTYCSNGCAKDQQKRQIEIACAGCGTEFRRRASLDTQYCSMSCWGEDHRVYSEEWYQGRWYEQRQKALERDGHQCTVCGISNEAHRRQFGMSLDVHHLVPVRLFAKWNVGVTDAHALRNLQTVCRTHHPDAPGTTVDPTE